MIQGVSKLGVLRPGAMGDVIVVLPALDALRKAYPEARITLMGRSWCQALLGDGRTVIDHFMNVPPIPGINDEKADDSNGANEAMFTREMQDQGFDLLVNLQGKGLRAFPLLRASGARITVGPYTKANLTPDLGVAYHATQHETLRAVELARKAGGDLVGYTPAICVLEKDREQASAIMPWLDKKNYVVVNMLSTDDRRNWPLENFRPLIRHLRSLGYMVLLTGSRQQRERIAPFAAPGQLVHNTAGMFTLDVLGAVLEGASLVVSPDTGPLHLARAVGTRTVGLYWAPHFMSWGPLQQEGHAVLVSWEMQCPLCGIIPNQPHPFEPSDQCTHHVSFIRNITPEEVIREAVLLLADQVQQTI